MNTPILIDTHAHLMEPQFSADLEDVLKRAADAGVRKMVNVGCTVKSSRASATMCLQYDFLFGTQGLHPSDFEDFSENLMREFFETAQSNRKIVAIGETGLDYHYKNADSVKQQQSFRAQMKLAEELNLPLIVHCRSAANSHEAEKDTLDILRAFPRVRCVMHCFAQDREYAQEVLKMPAGHIFSFSGTLTYPKADEVRYVASMLSEDRIVVETDCPYLPPQSRRGQRNEPAYIAETARKMAEIRGVSFEAVCAFTSNNAERFFSL